MSLRRLMVAALPALALLLAAAAGTPAAAKDPIYTGTFSNLAVSGYDPVAYFTEGRPVEGSGDIEYTWRGATWRFASQKNLEAFMADPAAYAPQYGGYCAWAVAEGYTASADPDAWRVVEGKLYLNYSKGIQKRWEQDLPGNIARADGNWPKVLE